MEGSFLPPGVKRLSRAGLSGWRGAGQGAPGALGMGVLVVHLPSCPGPCVMATLCPVDGAVAPSPPHCVQAASLGAWLLL